MSIYPCQYQDKVPDDAIRIDTTSRSRNWTRELSPFYLGPVSTYGNFSSSKNVENCWQYSKVFYKDHLDENLDPNEKYFSWAQYGWEDSIAVRYPAGKGNKPFFSYWDGEKLDYINARKKIYIPKYWEALKNSDVYYELLDLVNSTEQDIYLVDFDSYNIIKENIIIEQAINDPTRKFGHGFVIYMALQQYFIN